MKHKLVQLALWVLKKYASSVEERNWYVQFALGILKTYTPTIEERNLYTGILLEKVSALPISAIITVSENGTLINGAPVDFEKARVLQARADAALTNEAIKLCREQVRWVAILNGLATGLKPEDLLFYRAAIWYHDQLTAHLRLLAKRDQEDSISNTV